MARPNQSRDISTLLAVVVAVVVIATLYLARVVLIPFTLAMFATFLLTPVVIWLERIRVPRVLAVLLVVVLSVAAISSVGWVGTDQFINVTSKLPKYRANIKKKIESLHSPKGQSLNKATDDIAELGKELATAPTSGPAAGISGASESPPQTRPLRVQVVSPPTNLLESAGKLLGLLGTLGMVIIFTIFMLVRREDLRNRFIRLAGRGRLNLMTQALDEAAHRVSRYVFLQFIVNSCYGLLVGVALYFIGVPNALLWGVGAGLLRFLPYIGPPIGALLPILLSFAVFDGWGKSLIIIGLFVVLEVVVSSFVEPRLYGAHTGISALAILFAAIFWVLLWGPIGLILSTPLTVCLVVIGRHVPHLEFLQVILGDQPVLPPEAQFYQRLLATDQNEARQVLDRYLKDKSLEDLYDLVLIPALSLVEQDRHQNQLDEATQTFVFQSVKEVLEEIEDRSNEPRELNAKGAEVTDSDGTSPLSSQNAAAKRAISVVCMPVRDEADEIVGSILVHLLKKSGYRARYLDIGTTTEMLAQVMEEKPAIVFLSALPPFAVAHARRLYQALRAQTPDLKILIGLWHFSGDAEQAARRISGVSDGHISATLAHAMQQIRFLTAAAPRPAAESVIQTV